MSDPPTLPPPEAMLSDLDVRRIARAVCDEMEERERAASEERVRSTWRLLVEHQPEPPDNMLAAMTRLVYREVTGCSPPDVPDATWLQDVHARHVLDRWRDLGRPDPAEFLRQVSLIARAARESDELMFATHIRGIRPDGQRCLADRSRSLRAVLLTRPAPGSGVATWDERLRAAERWSQRSESSGSNDAG